jgi:hypothetical protein
LTSGNGSTRAINLVVVDLRTALDIEQTSSRTPWARGIPPDSLDDHFR